MSEDHPSPQFVGLSEASAQARLRSEGFNELPRPERRTPLRIVIEVLREPMLTLLLGAGVIYLLLGEPQDALVLLAFATLSISITVVQETRSERMLEALRDLTSPRAMVIRGGEPRRIAGREVVRGDLIILSEGDRVPADAIFLQCQDLLTDESLLTGESVPVRKIAVTSRSVDASSRPGGDDLPNVFAGSLVVRGSGIGEVIATGVRSEIGKIGQSLTTLETEPPRLRAQTRRVVERFSVVAGAICILLVLLYGVMRGGWLDAILAGIALGMSMLPEEFPMVLTVFMAMGTWRISRAHVLTRRAAAIETLGSATILCTDKTGTLTENRMSVAELRLKDGRTIDLHESGDAHIDSEFKTLVTFGILASAQQPFDPMEKAFHALRNRWPGELYLHGSEWKLVRSYGLRPELLAVSQVWQAKGAETDFVLAAKGAPEAIADLCHFIPSDLATMKKSSDAMAGRGLRVLAVARASYSGSTFPDFQHDFDFEFLGLVGLADPLRPGVPDAISQCHSAGLKVAMITGDYPTTALAIARSAGLAADGVVTGEDLDRLSDVELAQRVQNAAIFARIMPQQKLRVVTALRANGEIVAMTGDGVNDAPSLKAAHIGIAMGARGTDVAREASSIVLLNDDFGSIVKAVRLGRRIYDNLRKAMGFIFAVHVPIAGLALLPLVLSLPILLSPIHIAFLELVIDPVCSLVFEAEVEEDDVMRRPPRPPDEPLFSWSLVGWSLLQGAFAFAVVALIFVIAHRRGVPAEEVRALTFFSLVTAIISLIFVNRSFSASPITALKRPNPVFAFILLIAAVILTASLRWSLARDLFHFGPLHADDLILALGAGVIVLAALEGLKLLRRRKSHKTVAVQ